jgi:hypothetical protein
MTAQKTAAGSLGLHVIRAPSGSYIFVGRVPVDLSYCGPADAIETGRRFGFGLVKGRVEKLGWPTAEQAWQAAQALGHERCKIDRCACNTPSE